MPKVLLVTNDWPPVVGGIQTYLEQYATRLNAEPGFEVMVLTSTPSQNKYTREQVLADDAGRDFPVFRLPTPCLLPTPAAKKALTDLVRTRGIEVVWFGAAAPLGLLGPSAKAAGARKVIATTHGHEVGWAMIPGGRQLLRRIFSAADVVTYISAYTLDRFGRLIDRNTELVQLPSGIDTEVFHPRLKKKVANTDALELGSVYASDLRQRYGLGDAPTVVCVSRLVPRKGQDVIIKIWPEVVKALPDARLVIVGWGPYAKKLALLKRQSPARRNIVLTGQVPFSELPAHVALGDVFAMPCRTRGKGLDVEGLGIVFLEAQAAGVPVVAGDSGGAPETVINSVTGLVVDGRSGTEVAGAVLAFLTDPQRTRAAGSAGRALMEEKWTWPALVSRLAAACQAN